MEEIEVLLSKNEHLEKATKSLKSMAHPLRLKILCVLYKGEMSILDIVEKVGSSQSNISQHIEILRNKNILTSRRVGSKIFCRIQDARILEMIVTMKILFCEV